MGRADLDAVMARYRQMAAAWTDAGGNYQRAVAESVADVPALAAELAVARRLIETATGVLDRVAAARTLTVADTNRVDDYLDARTAYDAAVAPP